MSEDVFEIALGNALLGKHVNRIFNPEVFRDQKAAVKRGEEVFKVEQKHFFTEQPTGIDVKVFACPTEIGTYYSAEKGCKLVWRRRTDDVPRGSLPF